MRWVDKLLAIGALGFVLSACGADRAGEAGPPTTTPNVSATVTTLPLRAAIEGDRATTRLAIGGECIDVLVADSPDERSRGLANKDSLGRFDGMLFVWPSDVDSAFFMYQTRIPLAIGWYDADGTPIDRAEMVPCPEPLPADCPRYRARRTYRYALEVGAGELAPGAIGGCGA